MKNLKIKTISFIKLLILLFSLFGSTIYAFDVNPIGEPVLTPFAPKSQPKIIPEDQAFKLELTQRSDNSIEAYWQIAPRTYLYQSKIRVKFNPLVSNKLAPLQLPKGIEHIDEVMGQQIIYKNELSIILNLQLDKKEPVTNIPINIYYQGCAESGFCYPPQQKTFIVQAKFGEITYISKINGIEKNLSSPKEALALNDTTQNESTLALLNNKSPLSMFLGFLIIGLVLSFTPCVLPMVPILSTLIIGKKNLKTSKAFGLSSVYVLTMAISYAIAGVIVALLGQNLQTAFQSPIIITGFAALFFILGLEVSGIINIHIPSFISNKLHHLQDKQKSGSYLSAISLGLLATLIASPCVTAPLVAVLAFISQTGDTLVGGLSLFGIGLGMGLPLIIAGTLGGKYLPKAGPWMNAINIAFSIILFAFSIWLLERFLTGPVTMTLWTLLCLYAAYCMGSFKLRQGGLWPRIGILFVSYAVLLSVFTLQGNYDPLKPFRGYWLTSQNAHSEPELNFTIIKTTTDLKNELLIAKEAERPTLVTFYADWCISCKKIERTIFKDPLIKKQLKDWYLIRADVSNNNTEERALLKRFELVGPPSLLFFNSKGIEQTSLRLVGEIEPKVFMEQLNQLSNCEKHELNC